MKNHKAYVTVLAVLAVIFVGLAIYYWVTPAGSLPAFMPGHIAGATTKHMKHGLAAFILALGCGLLIWFMTGKKTSEPADTPKQ